MQSVGSDVVRHPRCGLRSVGSDIGWLQICVYMHQMCIVITNTSRDVCVFAWRCNEHRPGSSEPCAIRSVNVPFNGIVAALTVHAVGDQLPQKDRVGGGTFNDSRVYIYMYTL
jgi:hypothetical protein